MCGVDELQWPPCDPAPFTSVSNKRCIIIKAKSEFKVELKQLMNNFEGNYKRALACFYAQEAEQKARKQNQLLTQYIAQLQKYLQDVKAGVNAKRPKAPQEIYSEDPLDCVGECYSGMVTIGSVSIESETSIDLDYVEQKGLVSRDTLEILKKSSDSSQSIRQISSRKFGCSTRNVEFSSDVSKSDSVEIISEVSTKSLRSTKVSSKVGRSIQTIGEKPVPQTSGRSRKEKYDSDVHESSSKQIRLANSDKEEQGKSDDESSTWSLSDYATAGEEGSDEVTVKENSRAGDEERDIVSAKAASKNNSVSSLASNDTQITDYDEVMNKLQNKIRELDEEKNQINEQFNATVNTKFPNSKVKTKRDLNALVAEEQDLLNKISMMKTKLTKLDEVASEPSQLKDFCVNLLPTVSSKVAGEILVKTNGIPQTTPDRQPDSSSKICADSSRNALTGQLNHTRLQDISQSSNSRMKTNINQVDLGMPSNIASPNYTRRPPKSFDASYLQQIMSQHMKHQSTLSYNALKNEFPLTNLNASSQANMSASYEQIIGKLLHQNGNNERTNFMQPIPVTNFDVRG